MKSAIDLFLSEPVAEYTRTLAELERQIRADAAPESDAVVAELGRGITSMSAACARFEQEFGLDSSALCAVKAQFREAIWPWFGKSWFMNRGLTKPRGYPGDYEMLSGIYDEQPKSCGIGGYLDRYFLQTDLARAVRGRMQAARTFLQDEIARRGGKVSILNVACGPCREYVVPMRIAADQEVTITCVDNDPQSLAFAQKQVAPAMPSNVQFRFVQHNALRMASASGNIRRFGRNDIIYSFGLCDYIPDEYLIPLLKGWRESLNDGGVVYVAFKDTKRYDKTEYQWFVDWYFFQRTEDECGILWKNAGYDMRQMETARDATGVIINYAGHCKTPDLVRVDDAQKLSIPQHVELAPNPISGPVTSLQ